MIPRSVILRPDLGPELAEGTSRNVSATIVVSWLFTNPRKKAVTKNRAQDDNA